LLYKHQGLRRFYSGVLPIMFGCVPAHAAFFVTYELAKRTFHCNDGVRFR
jgi:hypothetical protein